MPKTEGDPLGPHFVWRLRTELDRIQPRFASPRYLSSGAGRRVGAWRLAPIALAIGLTGILGLSAWAATGSANPAVWTERARSVINATQPSPSPVPTPESTPPPAKPQAAPPAAPVRQTPATERPAPPRSPEPRESPEPSDDHSGSGTSAASGSRSATPSPTPTDH